MVEKLQGILALLRSQRQELADKDLDAVIAERVEAYRAKVKAEVEAEHLSSLTVFDIRIETAEKIVEELLKE